MATANVKINVTIDDLSEIKGVVATSLALYACECEFPDDETCCADYYEAWENAVIALRERQGITG